MRIFTFDIETTPNTAKVWHLFGDYVSLDQLDDATRMITWSGKFLGEKEIYFRDWNDPKFLTELYDLLEEADAVVTFNGDSFDIKHVNREFIAAGFLPPRRPASIDLYKTVKKNFKFPSNKLEYVASRLLGVHKLSTGGMQLWQQCMQGCPKAMKKMRRYNIQDVRVTERLYKFLRPWITNHPYSGVIDVEFAATKHECPVCSSTHVFEGAPRRTRCFAIQQLQCECGHRFDGSRRKF